MKLKYLFSLILFYSLSHVFYSAEYTWTGQYSTFYDAAGNWNVGGVESGVVPGSGDNITIPDVSGASTRNPEVRDSRSITNVSVNAGATLNINGSGTLTVSGTFNASGNTTFTGSGTLDLSGPVTSLGTFTENTGTVIYSDGSSQNIDADDYYNLTISGGATKTLQGNTNVGGNLIVTASSTILDVNTRTLDVSGTSTVSSAGKVTISTGTFDVDGEINADGGNVEFTDAGSLNLSSTVTSLGTFTQSTSTVTYDGTSDQNVDFDDYYNLVINGSSTKSLQSGGTTNVTNDLTVSGSGAILDVNSQTLDVNGTTTISSSGKVTISTGTFDVDGTINCTANLEFTDAGSLNLSSTVTSLGTFTKSTSTVTYDQVGNQSIEDVNYYNLTLSGSGNKTITEDTDVSNTLDVNSGVLVLNTSSHKLSVASTTFDGGFINISDGEMECSGTFDHNSGNLTMSGGLLDLNSTYISANTSNVDITGGDITAAGDWTGAADDAFDPSGGTVTFDGSSDQDLTFNASSNFFNLTISNTGSSDVDVANDLDINGNLIISSNADFDISAASNLEIAGDFTNSGTFTTDNETITFDGASSASESCPAINDADVNIVVNKSDASGTVTFANCTVNQFTVSDGIASVGTSTITADDAITVSSGAELTISSGTFNADGASDIDGTLSITSTGKYDADADFDATGATVTFSGAGFIEMSGSVTKLGSSFTEGSGTVEYDGSGAQNIFNTTYNNLIIDQNSTKTASANLDVDGDLTIDNSATLSMSASNFTLDLEGNFTITSGTFTAGTGSHDVAGNWDDSNSSGGFTPTAGTVTMSGSSKTINTHSGNNFFNLTSTGDKTVQSELDINGNLTVSSGEFALGANNVDVASSKTVDCDGTISLSTSVFTANGPSDFTNGTLSISSTGTYDANGTFTAASGNVTFTGAGFLKCNNTVSNLGTLTITSGTVVYDGASTQTIRTDNYYNLTIDQSGTKQALGTLDISGDLTVSNGAVFDINGQTAAVGGNWNDAGGTFQATGGGVLLTGGNANITTGGSNYFSALTIWSTGTKTAQSSLDINGNFTFNSGTFDINGQNADVAGNWNDANGTFQAGGGTVTLSGGNSDITTGGSNYFSALTINATGTKTAQSALDINGNFTLTAGTFAPGSNDVDVAGNWDDSGNNGGFTPSAATVTLSGTGTTVTAGTNNNFFNLTLSGGTKTAQTELDIDGDLTVSSGELATGTNNTDVASGKTVNIDGTLSISTGTFTANGPTDIDGTLSITSTGVYDADGTFTAASGNVTFSGAGFLNLSNTVTDLGTFTKSTSTVTYDEADAQTVDNVDYHHLVISGGATKTLSGSTNVGGDLTVTASSTVLAVGSNTIDVNGTSTITTNGTVTVSTGTYDADGTMNCSANFTFTGGGALNLSNTVTDLGTFTKSTSTVTYDEADAQTVDNVTYHHLILDQNGTKTASGNLDVDGNLTISNSAVLDMDDANNRTLDLEGDFTIASSGNFTARAGSHDILGNWDGSGGTFQSTSEGTVTLSGTSKTINTGSNNSFYNLTIAGTASTSTSNDVVVENDLTINSSKSLTVSPGDQLTLENVSVASSATLTVDADGSNNATLDFSTATSADFDVSGTLVLDGHDASNRAIVTSDDGTRIDVDITGTLTADYFTFQYPDINGLSVTGSNAQTISFGAFDYPFANGTLLNLTSASNITNDLITGCSFGNSSSVSGASNATANGSTGVITFTSFSGTLASNATVAEDNDVDSDNKLIWFNNDYYSDGNTDPNTLGNWYTGTNGTGLNPSNFTTATDNFVIQNGDTYTANAGWSISGDLKIESGGELVTGANTVSIDLVSDIDGTLTVSNSGTYDCNGLSDIDGTVSIGTGTYDADGEFDASSGNVTFTAAGNLNLSNTVTDLGTFTKSTGTVTYDEADAQDVDNVEYHNLTLSGSGNKTVQGSHGVGGILTVSSGPTLVVSNSGHKLTAASITHNNGGSITISDGEIECTGKADIDGLLTISGSGATLDVNGELELSSTTSESISNGNITVAGDFDGAAANNFTPTGGTLTMDGSGADAGITMHSSANFYNLTVNSGSYDVDAGSNFDVDGALTVSGGELDVLARTVTVAGASDVASGATLNINGSGVYDANGSFDANGGTINMDGTAKLQLASAVTNLGTLDNAAGTVEYNGGAQDVIADNYYDLVIDQSGDKTAQGTINVANDMTISNSATFLTSVQTIDITGATTVSAILDIGNGQFNSRGGFSATGNINFSHNGGKLNFFTVSPTSLGTLDNSRGTVDYESGATDVLADDYPALRIMGGGTAKTLQGDVNVADDLVINSGNELNLGNNTITVSAFSDIDGTLDFNNGGTFDANGSFDATNGTVQFTGSGGNLKLGGATVTSLGNTLTEGSGTIEYDYAGNQTVLSETYYNLTINNATGTKSAGGALDIDGDLTVTAGELAMSSYNADVATGKTVNIDGTLSITTGTFTANGSTSDIDGTLTINGAGIYDADGTFDGTSGTVQFTGSGGTLKLGGATVTSIGATFVHGTGTVEYDYAGNQSVKARNYYNLEIDGSSTSDVKSVVNSFTIDNNLTISSTSAFDVLARTITVTGVSDVNGILNINGSGILDANGSFDATSGSITMDGTARLQLNSTVTSLGTLDDAAGTVEYDQAGTQSILSAPTYYDLEIDGSGSKRTDGNTSTNGNVTITAGTLDLDFGNDNLTIGGNFANSGTLDATNQTITFSGSTQNTSSIIDDNTVDLVVNKSSSGGITFQGASSFDNVTISDGYLNIGAYTFDADNTISIAADGTLQIPNGGTFDADGQLTSSGTIDFTGSGSQGDLICSNTSSNTFGTLDDAAGTVTFDGSGSQAITATTFFNLKNSNTSGLTMSGDATVNGELNLNVAADITTGANTLTIGSSGSIANASADRHINVDNTSGYLGKTFGSASAFSFPVGNGTILRPIRLTTSAGSTTFKLRYDDNRYTSGNVSGGGFASGHISGFDGGNSDVTKGYYYDIQKTSGSANASLYVSWTSADDYGTGGNVYNANLTGIAWGTWNGSRWDNISSSASGSINSGSIETSSAVSNFSNRFFTLGSTDGNNNLPIDLISFDGECIDNKTHIEFVVASQVNNEYFTIERSKNLFDWNEIGHIPGGGTNNEEITYNFTDLSPISGDNYYKLSQTDIDGTTKSFNPIVVNCDSRVDNYNVFPNPTTNIISIEFELEYYQGESIELLVRDLKGTIIKSVPLNLDRGYNFFNVNLNDVPKGMYLLQYKGTKNHIPEKRVVKL